MDFNQAQMTALEHRDGPMMVLAGPGSGKTTVITHRIKRLLEAGVDPSGILVITFTKAAATEMKERFLRLAREEDEKRKQAQILPAVPLQHHEVLIHHLSYRALYDA